jgi:GrpB-like predicted nucleotidyltransferase (UPF0157 family)
MAEPPLTGDDPPAWAVEGVHLCAYDPAWPARATRYADELHQVLGRWLLGPIEHIGSTAIPGLIAKPVIDLMAQATNPGAVVRQTSAALAELDWRYVPPELDARPFRRFFAKVSADGQHRLAHLHLMFSGMARWGEQLKFRDALRADAAQRDDYAAVKVRLARSYPGDRERYTDEKAVFVTRALRFLDVP